MRAAFVAGTVIGLFLPLPALPPARAAEPGARQYYDREWGYNKEKKYYYRTYLYKPNKDDAEYKHQYLIYRPQRTTEWVYWYNPETRKYWARCATKNHATRGPEVEKGHDLWSFLPGEKRKDVLDAINDDDFGPLQEGGPLIPGAKDRAVIASPPTDLPPD
jgi:hypothetical protein